MSDNHAHPQNTRQVVGAAAAGLAATVIVIWLLHLHWLPLGIPGQWQWQVRQRPATPTIGLLLGAALVFFGGIAILDGCRRDSVRRAQAWASAAALVLGSYLLAVGAVGSAEGGWLNATLAVCSDLSFGYFTEAVKHRSVADFRRWLADTAARTDPGQVPARVATHPPGPVIFARWALGFLDRHTGLKRLLSFPLRLAVPSGRETARLAGLVSSAHPRSTEVAGAAGIVWFLALGAPAAVLGALAFGTALSGPRTGFITGALSATIPALHVFMPGIDAWAAAFAIWSLALLTWAARTERPFIAAAAGVVWGIGLQWTFGLSALLPIVAWLIWRHGRRRWLALAALTVAGVVAAHIPLMLMGYEPLANFLASMRAQRTIMASRTYLGWLIFNFWDLVLFFGPALVALCAAAGRDERDVLLPVGATVALLLLAGATRGEVGRIWSFLMPIAAAGAAGPLARLRETPLVIAGAVVIAAQLAVMMAYSCYLALVTP